MDLKTRIHNWRVGFSAFVQLGFLSLLPIMLVLSHRNVAGMVVFMGVGVVFYPNALRALVRVFRVQNLQAPTPSSVFLWLLLFCAYAALSLLWTPVPERWAWAAKVILFVLLCAAIIWSALTIDEKNGRRLLWTYVIGVTLACVMLGIEGLTGGLVRDILPPEGLSAKEIIAAARGSGKTLYLIIPVLLAIMADNAVGARLNPGLRQVAPAILLGLLAAAVLLLDLSANVLAFAVACGAAAAGYFRPRVAVQAVFLMTLGALMMTPFLALMLPPIDQLTQIGSLPASWVQRLIAWRFSIEHIFSGPENFLFGGGLNYSWALTQTSDQVQLPNWSIPLDIMPTHPHNIFLQVWLEFGAVGVSLVAVALAQMLRSIVTNSFTPAASACICAMVAVAFVFVAVEINLWTMWRFGGFALGVFAFILVSRQVPQNVYVKS